MTPSLACTGSSARWCPVCGDCACGPRYEGDGADGERTLDDAGCPLHGASSTHARDTAPDLAAQVLALADALATAERERDEARAALASALAPNAADAALDDIAHACGCASWGYPAQVARDVLAVVADRDAARAEAAGLRAIVEGRCEPPTVAEIDAHEAAGGRWLYDYRGRMLSVIASDVVLRVEAEGCRSGQIVDSRWWPLDRAGRPCAWPVAP